MKNIRQICNFQNLLINLKQKANRQMSVSSYIFTSVRKQEAAPDNPVYSPHTQLLALITAHPSFKTKVNSFLSLFPQGLTSEGIIKMGCLINAVLFPQYPKPLHRKMSVQLFNSLQIQTDEVTYTNLSEFLLKICSDLIQNIDVRSAVGILDALQSRIIDYFVIDVTDSSYKQKLGLSIKLEVFDSEAVIDETGLPEKMHRKAGEYVYYEQKILFQEDVNITPTQILVKKLKQKPESVIPLGYTFEQFSFNFINSNFEAKSSYRLKGNKCVQLTDKTDYWVTINQNTANAIRDFVVNQQIYEHCPIITTQHLPETISPPEHRLYNMYRLNQVFVNKNYYQKLKQITDKGDEASNKYFNILSEFYDRDEFNIDELAQTKEKLIIRRKEALLGIQGKQQIKKETKDFENQVRILSERINENKRTFTVGQRMEDNIRELSKSLRIFLEEDKNINVVINKMLSSCKSLPKDSSNPFEDDIISLAKKQPLQILTLGRAKSGKTTLAKAIAKQYSLVYISVENMVEKVIERSNFFKQNPPEADEDGNVKDGLLKIEECILADLQEGRKIEEEDILDLINIELKKQFTQSRGYILDLPFEYCDFWYKAIVSNKIYVPKIGCRFFNRIIQIEQTEEQWKHFLAGLMIKPEDLTINSEYNRYIRAKPKPPPQQGEQQEAGGDDDAEKPPPLVQGNMLSVKWENYAIPLVEHLTLHIHPLHFLKVRNSCQSVEEALDNLSHSLYKVPLPKKIQGAEKQLLTAGLDDQKVVRKWSPWGLTDCVQLTKEKLIMGKFQFAAEYAGRVFVFENENNLNAFINSPRNYVKKLPQLPKKTNIAIAGPRKSGKKTLAKILSEIYQLKIIDFEQILKSVILRQKQLENHIPSNPDKTSRHVHLSEQQFKQFSKGGLLSAKDVLPIILYELGIPLQKKPPGWGIQKTDEDGQEQVEEKKPPPKKAAKKKDKKDEDERPKTPPLEDLPLKEIIPIINHKGKLDEIKGFILVGFPHNQQQLNALKAFNIPIDKFILLSDNSEQNPLKTLSKRLSPAEIEQVANFMGAIGPVKQALGEEICKEITNLQQTPEEIINKIRQFIDPFYPKCDDDTLNRACADKQEEGDPIPMGFCGEYCPVTLAEGWLIKGKEQFEAGFQGKRFRFVGETQLNAFKENPTKYIKKDNLQIAPRVMVMGQRGVGLKTQLQKLNQQTKIPILNFKDTLIQLLQNQKTKRKSERYYNKGFKIPEFDQEGKQVEDPELNEESPEFDRGALEIEMTKKMFNGINDIFINGNYYDVEEDAVQTPFVDLLATARKLPEVVFMLKCDQKKWLQRNLNKKQIEEELERIKEKRREQKQREKEEARQKAIQAGEEYQQPQQNEDEDPEIPKLEQMISQKEEALKGQRQNDTAKLEELAETFKSWNVEVIQIKCERDIKHVSDRINYSLKPILEDRLNKWEQNNMLPIQRHRVRDFLNNYIALESRFGELNPFTLMKPVYSYPLIYNDRIYYLNDQEERDRVMRNPRQLLDSETNIVAPSDVKVIPTVSVIGLPKTGKTTLAGNISKRLGLVHIQIQSMIEEFFTQEHQDSGVIKILNEVKKGKTLSDDKLVDLIEKRVGMGDCQKKGYVLDGFPYNLEQCYLLNRRGLQPANIFCMKLTEQEIKSRVLAANKGKNIPEDDYDIEILHERLKCNKDSLIEVEVYYSTKFNNIKNLDGKISKWGIYETAKKDIECKVRDKKSFVRSLLTHTATPVSNIGLHFNCIVNNLSQFDNFCPISYKIRREYVKLCPRHHKNLVLHDKKIYIFAGQKEMKDFLNNPQNYKNKGNAFSPPEQVVEDQIPGILDKCENKGYCMVDLTRKKLVKGNSKFMLRYKNKYFMTGSASNMKTFIRNPVLFEMVKLQDKLPVEFEKKSDLKKIAKKNDCTAFLEHHLSNILMKSLAQLGYKRPKYPTLGSKESALKFLSIILKSSNPNKDDEYRQKYAEKLERFIKQSNYSQQIRQEMDRKEKGENWQPHDEENLLKLCEEYNEFLKVLNSTDKNKYFSEFIR